jgi:hypothetical protein
MIRLNWDSFGAEWTFDYRVNQFVRPYSEEVSLNCPQDEVVITGLMQSLTIFCEEDYQEIRTWMQTGSKLVKCPVFYRAPVEIDGVTSFYDPLRKCISWIDSPYKFSGAYYIGGNSNNFEVVDSNLPIEWKLDICPINRELGYSQPSEKNPITLDPIPFFVRPNVVMTTVFVP